MVHCSHPGQSQFPDLLHQTQLLAWKNKKQKNKTDSLGHAILMWWSGEGLRVGILKASQLILVHSQVWNHCPLATMVLQNSTLATGPGRVETDDCEWICQLPINFQLQVSSMEGGTQDLCKQLKIVMNCPNGLASDS